MMPRKVVVWVMMPMVSGLVLDESLAVVVVGSSDVVGLFVGTSCRCVNEAFESVVKVYQQSQVLDDEQVVEDAPVDRNLNSEVRPVVYPEMLVFDSLYSVNVDFWSHQVALCCLVIVRCEKVVVGSENHEDYSWVSDSVLKMMDDLAVMSGDLVCVGFHFS